MTEKTNMSQLLSSSSRLPPVSCRPKVVLVNPNFQKKQAATQKTIYINPLFKSASLQNKQVHSCNLTMPVPSSNLKKESTRSFSAGSASFANTSSSLKLNPKLSDRISKPLGKNDGIKNSALNTTCSISSYSHFKQSNQIEPNHFTAQGSVLSNVRQPKKTYVNRKFLENPVNTNFNTNRKASFFYINATKLKPEEVTTKTSSGCSGINEIKFSSSDSRSKVLPSSTLESDKIIVKQSSPSPTATFSVVNNDTPKEPLVESYSENVVSSCSSPLALSKSTQKKKLNLLQLRKITRLSQLAQISRMKRKDFKANSVTSPNSTNLIKNVGHSSKFAIKLFPHKHTVCDQNSLPRMKNNFRNHNSLSNNQTLIRKSSHTSDGPRIKSNFDYNRRQRSVFKKCSKFKLVRSEVVKCNFVPKLTATNSLVPETNLKLTNPPCSKKNQQPSLSLTRFNLRKFDQLNELALQQSTSQTSSESPACVPSINSEELPYNSDQKLVCKPLVRKTTQQKNRFFISKNKLIRNIDSIESKNYAARLKVHFKPSKTSADVINKRMIQRKVINRYKLLNVQRKIQFKPSKTSADVINKRMIQRKVINRYKLLNVQRKIQFKPSRTSADVINKRMIQRKVINRYKLLNVQQNQVKTRKLVSNNGKQIIVRKERRNSVIRNRNSSFVSIGKRKLIRRSVMNLKQPALSKNNIISGKVNRSNLRPATAFAAKVQRRNSQKFSWKASENGKNAKTVNNDLIAFGKTKLIKKSLLHWQRQINKLKCRQSNVAATSVMQKQLRRFCKSLPETHQNEKLQKIVQAKKLKLRNSLHSMKNKTLTKRRMALRSKNNIPCETFHKYGRCKKFLLGKCSKLHDRKYITICQAFVQGACKADRCLLSHEIVPQKMPTCLHFLQGACSRDNCPYPHVKLSAKAPICRDFVKGFCSLGLDCDKVHMLLCPELEKNGVCTNRPNCKFAHRKKIIVKKTTPGKSVEKKESLDSAVTEQPSKVGKDVSLSAETNDEPAKRYFCDSSENELESFIPKRPQLGSLPSFIPLDSCDSLKNS